MKCNELYCLRHLLAACTQWQIKNQQKESENNVCVWGKHVAGIKGTYECNGWHCLQYSKEIPARLSQNHGHSAILQDLIPATPRKTISAAVTEELCSCACLGTSSPLLGAPPLGGVPQKPLANGLNPPGVCRFPDSFPQRDCPP